jgi:hypothetical protein
LRSPIRRGPRSKPSTYSISIPIRSCSTPGRKVNELFGIERIPKTFLCGPDGELVATAIDRRTERQFLELLKMAKLE